MAQSQQPPAPTAAEVAAKAAAEQAAWDATMGGLPTFNRPFYGETPEETQARLKARALATNSLP